MFVCEGAGREGSTLTCRNGEKCCLNDGWERACGLIMLLKDSGLLVSAGQIAQVTIMLEMTLRVFHQCTLKNRQATTEQRY